MQSRKSHTIDVTAAAEESGGLTRLVKKTNNGANQEILEIQTWTYQMDSTGDVKVFLRLRLHPNKSIYKFIFNYFTFLVKLWRRVRRLFFFTIQRLWQSATVCQPSIYSGGNFQPALAFQAHSFPVAPPLQLQSSRSCLAHLQLAPLSLTLKPLPASLGVTTTEARCRCCCDEWEV